MSSSSSKDVAGKKRKTALAFNEKLAANHFVTHTASRHARLIGGCICTVCYGNRLRHTDKKSNKYSYDFRTVTEHVTKNGVHGDIIGMADPEITEAFIASFQVNDMILWLYCMQLLCFYSDLFVGLIYICILYAISMHYTCIMLCVTGNRRTLSRCPLIALRRLYQQQIPTTITTVTWNWTWTTSMIIKATVRKSSLI